MVKECAVRPSLATAIRRSVRRRDVIIIGSPDIYHCNYYYCYLLLMIVYVGIVRASLLINIVRFDLARLHRPPELPSTPSAPSGSPQHTIPSHEARLLPGHEKMRMVPANHQLGNQDLYYTILCCDRPPSSPPQDHGPTYDG